MIRYEYHIFGVVQGVGFRPFVYKLARELNLSGYVLNNSNGVKIELEGKVKDIEIFDERLMSDLPLLAHIDSFEKHPIDIQNETEFTIIQTQNIEAKTTLISPDIKVCHECLDDIKNLKKYHNYFATNCTNCGPRYSIINTVPYDRKNTSMSEFVMCESCKKEYKDPLNRRYHAQPISCNDCGPKLELRVKNEEFKVEGEEIFSLASNFIKSGKIGAIKGIGGFHIVCDATNDEVIKRLRTYKNRPAKPFALMCKDLKQIKIIAKMNDLEKKLLLSKEAPIVILKKLPTTHYPLPTSIAPAIDKIGCFLPYTPLHFLLFEHLDTPIVATSANLGGEPIITTKEDIDKKLPFVDFVLDFNREIINAVDDSLVQVVHNKINTLRLARGYAPKVIKLPFKIKEKILAVGANAKVTIAMAFDDTIILSPHIGDLNSLVAFEYFERTIETFKRFYDFEADLIVHDMHPNYETTKWAKQLKIKNSTLNIYKVQHHLAHIYSVKAEYNLQKNEYLGFSFDGTGYGLDGTLWGGEVFINDERKYHFKSIKLLGGQKAIKEPRRVALAILFERYTLDEIKQLNLPLVESFSSSELSLLYHSYTKNINSFDTSSVGRLFDAVASFANISQVLSYEGESGLLIESNYDENIQEIFTYTIIDGVIDIKIIDFISNNSFDEKILSSMLINTLEHIILNISQKHQQDIILTGGVFQNKTLLEKVLNTLEKQNRKYHLASKIATNDGGISLGQIYYYLMNFYKD